MARDDSNQALLDALRNPLRRSLLRRYFESREMLSPKELAGLEKKPLSGVSYHVRVLAKCGAIEEAGDRRVRGSIEHFYAVRTRSRRLPRGMRVGATIVYVAVMVGVVVMANAGITEAVLVWAAASFCVGWISRNPWSALLPLLAIPIAVPFGYPDKWTGGDPLLLWSEVLLAASIQAVIVFAGFGGRRLIERFRASRT
jgi:DNA-binding transcriptional ArsR family regulator